MASKRLVANIKGVELPIEDGVVFKDEYNEQLDSGTIIIPQSPKLDIEPFNDVYIYPQNETFEGVNTNYAYTYTEVKKLESIAFSSMSLSYNASPVHQNLNSIKSGGVIYLYSLATTLEVNGKTLNLINALRNYGLFSSAATLTNELNTKVFNVRLIQLDFTSSSDGLEHSFRSSVFGIDDFGLKITFDYYKDDIYQTQVIGRFTTYLGLYAAIAFTTTAPLGLLDSRDCWVDYRSLIKNYKITYTFENRPFTPNEQMNGNIYADGYGTRTMVAISGEDSTGFYNGFGVDATFVSLNDYIIETLYTFEYDASEENTHDPFYFTWNVEKELSFEFDAVAETVNEPSYLKHLVIDSYTEEQLNTAGTLFQYKITLFSETKLLEKNAITQKIFTSELNGGTLENGLWTLIERIVALYNSSIKIQNGDRTWEHLDEFVLDQDLKPLFDRIPVPDLTFEKTNLREILTQLFLIKDMIPIVRHRIISGFNITKRNNLIVNTQENLPIRLQGSDDYSTALIVPHEQSISKKQTTKSIEYIGFRNHDKGLMTLADLELILSKPILQINKMYMCYYKRFNIYDADNVLLRSPVVMVKQDITPIVLLQGTINVLSEDFVEMEEVSEPTSIEDFRKYKPCCIGYNIGDTTIKGWGTKYSWQINTWWNNTKTYLENIWSWFDKRNPAGINGLAYLVKDTYSTEYATVKGSNGVVIDEGNLISPFNDGDDNKLKAIFFQVEYQAFFEGATKHTKDKLVREYQAIDNPSSSVSWLDKLGSFEKEKLNRFANAIQIRTAIHKSLDELYELGDYDEDDYIVFSREYAIDAGSITANYKLIKDYVLKDYYTNVNTRLRPFALIPYNQSIIRKENRTSYVFFSTDKCYFEKHSGFINTTKNEYELLLSGFAPNQTLEYIDDFQFPDVINFAYYDIEGDKYLTQFNKEAVGNSLIFNANMIDNVSAGTKIRDDSLSEELQDSTIGTLQAWYMLGDENGYLETIGFYFSHIDSKDIFGIDPFIDSGSVLTQAIYTNHLFPMPLLTYATDETNIIGKEYTLYKDNRERINFTSQFEFISDGDTVLIGNRFLELNDLINDIEHKVNNTYIVSKTTSLGGLNLRMALWSVNNEDWTAANMNNKPVMWVDLSDVDLIDEIDTDSVIIAWTESYAAIGDLPVQLSITIGDFEIVNANTFRAKIKSFNGRTTTVSTLSGTKVVEWRDKGIYNDYFYFYRNGYIPNLSSAITLTDFGANTFVCAMGNTIINNVQYRIVELDIPNWRDTTFQCENVKALLGRYSEMVSFNAIVDVANDGVNYEEKPLPLSTYAENKTYYQNMYVYDTTGATINMKQYKDYQLTYTNLNSLLTLSSVKPNLAFDFGLDSQNRPNLATPLPYAFYYRENATNDGDDKMTFCFMTTKPKVYVSLLTNKDQIVYSPNLMRVGENKNYAISADIITNEQYIDFDE